jgi:hypothetical protein
MKTRRRREGRPGRGDVGAEWELRECGIRLLLLHVHGRLHADHRLWTLAPCCVLLIGSVGEDSHGLGHGIRSVHVPRHVALVRRNHYARDVHGADLRRGNRDGDSEEKAWRGGAGKEIRVGVCRKREGREAEKTKEGKERDRGRRGKWQAGEQGEETPLGWHARHDGTTTEGQGSLAVAGTQTAGHEALESAFPHSQS